MEGEKEWQPCEKNQEMEKKKKRTLHNRNAGSCIKNATILEETHRHWNNSIQINLPTSRISFLESVFFFARGNQTSNRLSEAQRNGIKNQNLSNFPKKLKEREESKEERKEENEIKTRGLTYQRAEGENERRRRRRELRGFISSILLSSFLLSKCYNSWRRRYRRG